LSLLLSESSSDILDGSNHLAPASLWSNLDVLSLAQDILDLSENWFDHDWSFSSWDYLWLLWLLLHGLVKDE